ncbi:hypothetical protein [Bacillus solimangrovi]|uniref:Uncharacterized protein n=1 Tax=Bacillus solimangrovi TaxID=1305675 RepID=A0A1E5LCA0_9BACI|nr:hypothetical protein [Bacillus solimangrovi]OEH91712.1 hypothetical protein BFG57_17995 [Bacillus solimangrovi]
MLFISLTLMLFFLSACQTSNVEELYEGVSLKIAVVGELPNIREDNITFNKLSLNELYHANLDVYDAVFIMEDHLSDAANEKYVKMYKEKKVPYFFVGSKAYTIPFQDFQNPASYEVEAKKVNDTYYFISGLLYEEGGESFRSWSLPYSYIDNEIQRDNVQGVYSRVFEVIEKEIKVAYESNDSSTVIMQYN